MKHCFPILLLLHIIPAHLFAQDTIVSGGQIYQLPYFTYGSGLGITSPDSLYQLNIRFRMQNRFAVTSQDNAVSAIEARVRRLRLRFDGFVFTNKLSYVVQLSFSSGDIGGFVEELPPNILRDAMVIYQPNEKWYLGFGQTKLPGNRQRVNSSGDLQLVDRAISNAVFNIDRDFGFQVRYYNNISGTFVYGLRGAITSGEGRNWISSVGNGLSYTLRLEALPLGTFIRDGNYFEGDLFREPTPKLAIGLVYNYNHKAKRTAGQRGNTLFSEKNLKHFIADIIFKYRGFAFESEYLTRYTEDPISVNPDNPVEALYVYRGHGFMAQSSYLFKRDYELVGRYTYTQPHESIRAFIPDRTSQYIIGINKYLRGHRLKLQADITYEKHNLLLQSADPPPEIIPENWQYRIQIELGI
jgi:hypothetical protein